MLPCAVWHTVAARHRMKTIKPSVERSSRPPADAHNKPYPWPNIYEWEQAQRRCVPPYCTWSEYWYFSIYNFNLSSILLWTCTLNLAEAPVGVYFEKVKFKYFMHPEYISVTCILTLYKNTNINTKACFQNSQSYMCTYPLQKHKHKHKG